MRLNKVTGLVSLLIVEILLSANSTLFSQSESWSQANQASYETHIFATVSNSTCNRRWSGKFTYLINEKDPAANSTFLFTSRQGIQNLHRHCRRQHPSSWKFCILDRNPFSLRWIFSSFVTCENAHKLEKFQLMYNERAAPSKPGHVQYVNVMHENIDNYMLNRALQVKRRRNYFNTTEGFISIAFLILTLCQYLNASTMVLPTYKQIDEDSRHHHNASLNHTMMERIFQSTALYPRIFARTLTKLDKMAHFESNRYVRIESVDFNFIYCDHPRFKSSNFWDLSVIFQAFQTEVWILLFVLLLICSVILSRTCFYRSHVSAALSLFSALLGGNMSFGLKSLKYSILFILWTIASMILNNYYTGSLTSLLIKPLGEDVMTGLADLDKHNYKLVFTDVLPSVFRIVNASAYGTPENNRANVSNSQQYNQTAEIEMLKRAIGSNTGRHHLGLEKFLEQVAFGNRRAAFGPWSFCLVAYNRVIGYIKKINSHLNPSELPKRHCHLGKNLVPSGGLFWGFSPPDNEKPASTFQQLIETGIYDYWMEEFYGIGYANRVQDRSKVKSPTSIVEDDRAHDANAPMDLREGHVMTIFVIWMIGIKFTILALALEVMLAFLLRYIKHRKALNETNVETITW